MMLQLQCKIVIMLSHILSRIEFIDIVQKKINNVPKKFIRAALREKLNDERKLQVM